MKNTCLKFFSKPQLNELSDFFQTVHDKFKKMGLDFFVVGAIARDILFYEKHR
jgi:tRNA nucleotidyltransferase/poly(A) polymerase